MARRRMISKQLAQFTTEGISYTGILDVKEKQTIEGREVGRYELHNEVMRFVVNGTIQIDDAMEHAQVGQLLEIKFVESVLTSNDFWVKRFEVYVLEEGEEHGKE